MRLRLNRQTLRHDITAGVVLGAESVPDGLSFGVLAGVNPLAGLYGYLFGTVGGALLSGTSVMTVQVTGAMALIVADTDLAATADPTRALYTLAILTGVILVAAGLLGAGALLRFVPRAVMVGFISGIGVNTVLSQLPNFTGYDASGDNRVLRTLDLLLHFWQVDLPSLAVGVVTLTLILLLQRTRVGAMGLVVAVVVGSLLAEALSRLDHHVEVVGDIAPVPNALPGITAPVLRDVPGLVVPAVALAFVAMVQGAGVAAAFPNPDGRPAKASRDLIGQGSGSVLSGLFQGMPAGGSMSATALVVAAGARSRLALFVAGAVMAVIVVAAADAVGYVAFPALAALLIVVGCSTIRLPEIRSAIKTGRVQATVVAITFGLTIVIPVQYAVLAGVALAILLFVVEQSNAVTIKRLRLDEQGRIQESDVPETLEPDQVTMLQPYGSLFFASASMFEAQLPQLTGTTRHAVVIMRMRGIDNVGVSVTNVLLRYASDLAAADSRLVLAGGEQLRRQLARAGTLDQLGPENFYVGDAWHGRTLARARDDGLAWIAERNVASGEG